MRRVVLVCGPPCAGKSTFVAGRRGAADLVADFDAVARHLGSPGKWMHPHAVGDAAEREMDRLTDEVAGMTSGTAWVIRCAPEPDLRSALAVRLHADRVVVLLPPLGVLMARSRQRPLAEQTRRAVLRWTDRYSPWVGDELIRGVADAEPAEG
jgi:5-methylcytosine-specific restriction protein A